MTSTDGSDDNHIEGNFAGTNPAGTGALGNGGTGVNINGLNETTATWSAETRQRSATLSRATRATAPSRARTAPTP